MQRYKFVPYGGGVEELDRLEVRDRIRAGEITADTELAPAGTDDWRRAVTFPELVRYFEIAAAGSPPRPIAKQPPPAEPMRKRFVDGLAYPLAGGEAILLVGLAVLSVLPVFRILATLASTMIMVEIIRTSADGRTKMPMVDTSQSSQLVHVYARVLMVTFVSLLPVLFFGWYAFGEIIRGRLSVIVAIPGLAIALAFAALYYPACLATVAVWDSVLDSLNPVYIVRVIRIIGRDYFIVVAMWFVATTMTTLFSSPLLSPAAMIPIIGPMFGKFLSYWSLFYVSHLLGYAVYRHAHELGWE